MTMLSESLDDELLRRFTQAGEEEAFAELVGRHLNLVWSAAWRVTGDADLARDVAQTVFADLARKARWLPQGTVLAGWLHRGATFAASKAVRANARRAERERTAMEQFSNDASDGETDRLLPLLDEAVANLAEVDRNAVAMRFLERKSLAEVGFALGVSDDAAQKRLTRAVDKLRRHFQKRGVTVTGAALTAAMGAAAGQAAPTGLATMVAAGSMAVSLATPASLISSLTTPIQLQLTAMKAKLAIIALATVTVSAPVAFQQHTLRELRRENELLRRDEEAIDTLRRDNAELQSRKAVAEEIARLAEEQEELSRLKAESARLRESALGRQDLLAEWTRAEDLRRAARGRAERLQADIRERQLRADTVEAMKNLGLAARVFANDHGSRFPTTFEDLQSMTAGGFAGGLTVDTFEFVPQGRATDESNPQALLFREKQPRQLADGTWARCYALADGSVQESISPDGRFEEWERQHGPQAQPRKAQ